ncbi:MAG: metal-dependent hydrolase [Alphaproteobacteria bacterium]
MADITIRNPVFDFSGPIDLEVMPGKPDMSAFQHGLSMTMPYVEPYLIRTMRTVMKELPQDDPLMADVRNFCGQEGNHYRNHMAMNDAIRDALPAEHAARLRETEAEMEAHYQRFTKEKPLKYNVTYAEGFEAMTFAIARTSATKGIHEGMLPWAREMWEWHLAEEVEHRTVTFDVYKALYGGYFYRLWWGTQAQGHFASFWNRFTEIICEGMTGRAFNVAATREDTPTVLRFFLPTLLPTYNPGRIPAPASSVALLERFS